MLLRTSSLTVTQRHDLHLLLLLSQPIQVGASGHDGGQARQTHGQRWGTTEAAPTSTAEPSRADLAPGFAIGADTLDSAEVALTAQVTELLDGTLASGTGDRTDRPRDMSQSVTIVPEPFGLTEDRTAAFITRGGLTQNAPHLVHLQWWIVLRACPRSPDSRLPAPSGVRSS